MRFAYALVVAPGKMARDTQSRMVESACLEHLLAYARVERFIEEDLSEYMLKKSSPIRFASYTHGNNHVQSILYLLFFLLSLSLCLSLSLSFSLSLPLCLSLSHYPASPCICTAAQRRHEQRGSDGQETTRQWDRGRDQSRRQHVLIVIVMLV